MSLTPNCAALLRAAVPHLSLDEAAMEAFGALYRRLVELNEKINVTAVKSEADVVLKHFADSLTLFSLKELKEFRQPSCFDIGCGGGFPGLPLALMEPQMKLTMIDSTEKKIRALEESCQILGLSKIRPVAGRAEELAAPQGLYREKGDLVFSRALARLDVLCELCLPFVRVGGYFVAMKGRDAEAEVAEAKRAIPLLGGHLVRVVDTTLAPDFHSHLSLNREELAAAEEFAVSRRFLVVIKKTAPCHTRYPRRFAQIKKSPL